MAADKVSILFLCTGNICRSPMAEGILRDLLPVELLARADISSAGVGAMDGLPPSEFAITACEENGIDIAAQRSRMLTPAILADADLVLAMEEHHRAAAMRIAPAFGDRVRLLSRFAAGDDDAPPLGVPDPIGGDLAEYRGAYRMIRSYLEQALPRIAHEIDTRAVES